MDNEDLEKKIDIVLEQNDIIIKQNHSQDPRDFLDGFITELGKKLILKGIKGDTPKVGKDFKQPEAGPQGKPGPQGDKPTDKELVDLIIPLIPEPIPGEPGEPGADGLTPTTQQILSLVKPLIPTPLKGKKGDKGDKGDSSSDTGIDIVAKLSGIEGKDRLSFYALKDQPQYFSAPTGTGGVNPNSFTSTDTIIFSHDPNTNTISANAQYQVSIDANADGLKLVGDELAPGVTKYYGTGGLGQKGWFDIEAASVVIGSPVGGGTANSVLFTDVSGNLANDSNFSYASGTGLIVTSTTGTSATLSTTSGIGAIVLANPATTNTTHELLRLTRNTSGTASAGIGSSLNAYLEDAGGQSELSAGLDFILTDVTNGAEDSVIAFRTRNNGTVAEKARLDNTGKFNAVQLESTVSTGTAPLVVASTTLVTNLNADLLDGQTGSYYLDRANQTGTQGISTITMNTGRLLGRTTASTGAVEEITPNATNFTFASGALNTVQNIDTGATPRFATVYTPQLDTTTSLTIRNSMNGFIGYGGNTNSNYAHEFYGTAYFNAGMTIQGNVFTSSATFDKIIAADTAGAGASVAIYGSSTNSVSATGIRGIGTQIGAGGPSYGGHFAAVEAGDTSGTTYGIYATASGSVVNNWAGYFASGNVNIENSLIVGGSIVGTWGGGLISTQFGGTGLTTWTQGDIPYYTSGTVLSKLAKDTNATRYLSNQGSSNSPAWNQINLANGVTGDLPFANITQASARSVLGVTGNSTADVASIQGTANQALVINSAGTALTFGAVNLASSAAATGRLPYANITQASARSVLGVTGNSTADVASIVAPSAYQILVSNSAGTGISFTSIDISQSNAVGTSILKQANGGTNSSSAFGANRIIVQNAGNTAFTSYSTATLDVSGNLVATSITGTSRTRIPQDQNGGFTSNGDIAVGDSSGTPSFFFRFGGIDYYIFRTGTV